MHQCDFSFYDVGRGVAGRRSRGSLENYIIQLQKSKQAVFEHQYMAIPLFYTTSGIYSHKVTNLNYFHTYLIWP
jgi:hypothetical protein